MLEYSDSYAFTLEIKIYSDSRPFTHNDDPGNTHDELSAEIVNKWCCLDNEIQNAAKRH